ncbi:MAG TPA: hypothetical protein VGK40_09470 [Verrucomicrobiae bacterium]|jgi:hypothetical protein
MKEAAIVLAICFGVLILFLLTMVTIRYRITRRFLKITWLGLPVRLMRLNNIARVGFNYVPWAEMWVNTLRVGNRRLVIHKRFGLLFKHVVITPRNHFVFKAEMDRVLRQPPSAQSTVKDESAPGASAPPPNRN